MNFNPGKVTFRGGGGQADGRNAVLLAHDGVPTSS